MRILVTAGPTHEYLDDVRFLSNPSSGKLGYAIARAAARRDHAVALVSGPVTLQPPTGVPLIPATSATEMHRAVMRRFRLCDALFMTAAVGDFRPRVRVRGKIKKDEKRALTLRLVPNPDILAECGRRKKRRQILVGFALESANVAQTAPLSGRAVTADRPAERNAVLQKTIAFAKGKLARKNLDFIFLNSPTTFRAEGISGLLLSSAGDAQFVCNVPKTRFATRLVRLVERLWAATGSGSEF